MLDFLEIRLKTTYPRHFDAPFASDDLFLYLHLAVNTKPILTSLEECRPTGVAPLVNLRFSCFHFMAAKDEVLDSLTNETPHI